MGSVLLTTIWNIVLAWPFEGVKKPLKIALGPEGVLLA